MANFRTNHKQNRRHASGSGFARSFVLILIAFGILLVLGLLIKKDYFKTATTIEVSDSYTIPESGIDSSKRYFLPSTKQGKLVHHTYYSLSYVEKYELAEWVAYELTRESLRKPNVARTNWYHPDPGIKSGSADYYDYQGSGYTRGHLAPAGDMAFNESAMEESFFMSNMAPQVRAFNNGIWKELEENVRDWAFSNNRLFVITGPVLIDPGKIVIGKNRVSVPSGFYKVILDIDEPEIKAIGFIIPNEKSSLPIMHYAVPVDSVESLTGIDFFRDLMTESWERRLESAISTKNWPVSEERFKLRVVKWNHE